MLHSLSVKNFILIDELEIEFSQGLCVVTGETGAGKSILLDAILFCLGFQFGSDVIKAGNNSCCVSAIFSISSEIRNFLLEIEVDCDKEVVIKRVQLDGNRKKFLINDQIVTQKTVQQLANQLVELHGQHNNNILLNTNAHLDILDEYGELTLFKTSVAELYKKWQNLEDKILLLANEKQAIENEIDYLSFVVDELTTTDVKSGEENELAEIRQKFQNSDKDSQFIQDLLVYLEEPLIDQAISKAQRSIARTTNVSLREVLEDVSKKLENIYDNMEDSRKALRYLLKEFDYGERNLDEVEERLFKIRALAKKYAVPSDDLEDYLAKSKDQLELQKSKITEESKLCKELNVVKQEYMKAAIELTNKRKTAAFKLKLLVQQELALVKMEKAVFDIEISIRPKASQFGNDIVQFIASTNPGSPFSPINKIASGGELSRFMLALRTALYDRAIRPTVIFDEIDTGIGGAVADCVGERLKKLSNNAQLIVITHQPQVASKSDLHILVEKEQLIDHTITNITVLNQDARIQEIARMISGKLITDASLKAAKELLNIENIA